MRADVCAYERVVSEDPPAVILLVLSEDPPAFIRILVVVILAEQLF